MISRTNEYDVSGVIIDAKTRNPLAVVNERDRIEWKVLDRLRGRFRSARELHRGDFCVTSITADETKWVVAYTADDGPVAYYLYDRPTKKGQFLFFNNSKLEKVKLAQMEPISYKAKDGLTIHGYLTKPIGVEAKNLPTVLLVHGGPWGATRGATTRSVQWLANRGYAVLQVNFRGSTGYGKSFLNAGNRNGPGKMHQDLIDAQGVVGQAGGRRSEEGRASRAAATAATRRSRR